MSRGLEASEDRLGNSTSSSMITCMCWHPQMKILAVARDDSSIVVYSCASSSWCAKLDNCPYGDEITSMCFHPTEPLWSHYLIELASAVRSADNEAIVVRCDGLKVSEDGQDVILFMRPEASEKPRKRVLLPGVDDSSPDFDPDNDENYLYIPVEGDDERRFFIFLSAKKGCEMIKNWEERDPEEELEEGAEEQFYSRLLYTKRPKEESCQDALPLNNGLWA